MKRLAILVMVALLIVLPTVATAGDGQTKVDVCHITGSYDFGDGNGSVPVGHIICIACMEVRENGPEIT